MTSHAIIAPGPPMFSLATKHFHIHYPKSQEQFAKKFVHHLELAYPLLIKDLAWTPDTPFDIVVNDIIDEANGLAYSFPANKIEVYPVAAGPNTALMDYHDWVEQLAIHELVHIIANDTVSGLFRPLRTIFGNVIKPNGLQPRWLVEGLAVFYETKYTKGGRGNSAFTESILRNIVLENKLNDPHYFQLDQLNDGNFWWPAGNMPYLFGYTLQAYLEHKRKQIQKIPKYGFETQDIPAMISIGNSRRFPYFLHGNLENILGMDWDEAWADFKDWLGKRYPQKEAPTEICQLTEAGRYTGGMSLAEDGWIYFVAEHPLHGQVLAKIHPDSKCIQTEYERTIHPVQKERFIVLAKGLSSSNRQVSVYKNYIAYTKLEKKDPWRRYTEIFIYNSITKKSEALTKAKRAKEPSFSPDGKTVFYARNLGNGKQSIEAIDFHTKSTKQIFESDYFEDLSSLFVNSNTLYFVKHNNQGQAEIFQLNLHTNKLSKAIPHPNKGERFFERDPFVKDNVIYYSASYQRQSPLAQAARYDIYRWQKQNKKLEQISQTKSGLSFRPIVLNNQNDLLITEIGLFGFNLAKIKAQKITQSLNTNAPHKLHSYLGAKSEPIENRDLPKRELGKYSAFSTAAQSLFPKYWTPIIGASNDGYLIGVLTSGNDPLNYHNYSLGAFYDSRASFPHYSVNYLNLAHRVYWNLFAQQTNYYLTGLDSSNKDNFYAIQATIPFKSWSFSIGAAYKERNFINRKSSSPLAFSLVQYSTKKKNPAALAANQGMLLSNYIAVHSKSNQEKTFVEWKPSAFLYFPGIFASDSMQFSLRAGITTNKLLASNYYLGGGLHDYGNNQFTVIGYPSDTLLGQKIFTANFAYTSPINRVFSGWGINPLYFRNLGIRYLASGGTANFISRYNDTSFIRFDRQNHLWKQNVWGVGVDLFLQNTIFYYMPLELSLSVHHGFNQKYGGETRSFIGVNLDAILNSYSHKTAIETKKH